MQLQSKSFVLTDLKCFYHILALKTSIVCQELDDDKMALQTEYNSDTVDSKRQYPSHKVLAWNKFSIPLVPLYDVLSLLNMSCCYDQQNACIDLH